MNKHLHMIPASLNFRHDNRFGNLHDEINIFRMSVFCLRAFWSPNVSKITEKRVITWLDALLVKDPAAVSTTHIETAISDFRVFYLASFTYGLASHPDASARVGVSLVRKDIGGAEMAIVLRDHVRAFAVHTLRADAFQLLQDDQTKEQTALAEIEAAIRREIQR